MHDYLLPAEFVKTAVLLGVLASTLVYERFQVTTGGVIVPGYLALFVLAPLSIVVTLAVALVVHAIVNGPVASRTILYGRRKFELEVLLGLGLVALVDAAVPVATRGLGFGDSAAYAVGFVLPGVIAHDMFRQGRRLTVVVTLLAALAVAAVVIALAVVLPPAAGRLPGPELFEPQRTFGEAVLLPAVIVSVIAGLLAYRIAGIRTGGFVAAAYLAMVAAEPRDLLFTVAIAAVTFVLVKGVLTSRLLLFGRRKMAAMVIVAGLIAWTAELVIVALDGGAYRPWAGLNAIALMAPALLANDAERQGPLRTVVGTGLATALVAGAMLALVVLTGAGGAG